MHAAVTVIAKRPGKGGLTRGVGLSPRLPHRMRWRWRDESHSPKDAGLGQPDERVAGSGNEFDRERVL